MLRVELLNERRLMRKRRHVQVEDIAIPSNLFEGEGGGVDSLLAAEWRANALGCARLGQKKR
jgi:hypothetical protein